MTTLPHNGPRDPETGAALAAGASRVSATADLSPGIPGDDIPLTAAEMKHFDELVEAVIAPKEKAYTPPPIVGYRKLLQHEVDLMNRIKIEGQAIEGLIFAVRGHLLNQRREAARLMPVAEMDAELRRIDRAEGDRWSRIATTHFQEGLMALTRAVAQPSNF